MAKTNSESVFMQQKWEYLVVVLAEQADINQYGEEGWDLLSVNPHAFNESTYYFKRLKN
jgi:hypothetical protein